MGGETAGVGLLEEGSALVLGVEGELVVGSGFNGAGAGVAARVLAFGAVACVAGAALDRAVRVSRGSGAAGVTSTGAAATGAGVLGTATLGGAAFESALLAIRTGGSGALTTLSFTLWSNTSAPPITEAVMIPKAIPKWFTRFSWSHGIGAIELRRT